MKAITIKQPWATLIALGEKKFETRSWQTKHRGPLAIHAGKEIDKDACREFIDVLNKRGIESINQLPTGAVIATVDLIECHKVLANYESQNIAHTTEKVITSKEYPYGDYTEGRFAWELANLNVLPEPVLAKGQLSLWEWDGAE